MEEGVSVMDNEGHNPQGLGNTPTRTPGYTAVLVERERCASIAGALAEKLESSAAEMRAVSTRTPRWFGKPYVLPGVERDAKMFDEAARGLRIVERLIRDGATRLSHQQNAGDGK